MIPVIGVPYVNRPDLLQRLVESLGGRYEQLIIIDNSFDRSAPEGGGARCIRFGHNMGVSAAWNTIIKATPRAPWWFIVNSDIQFIADDLERMESAMAEHPLALLYSMAAFGISRSVIEKVGWFDENFVPAYCLVPETPVLTDDLRWVRIGDLHPGDGLVGVDEHVSAGQRRFRRSVVTAVSTRRAPCVRLVLADGREVTCTLDHRWLAKPTVGGKPWEWRRTDALALGHRLQVPLDIWQVEHTFSAGWLCGILDGEGCLHHTNRMAGISISQREGPVLDRIRRSLDELGIPFTWRLRKPQGGRRPVANVEVSARRKAMELVGRLRPERLNRPELWEGRSPRSRSYRSDIPIVSITPVGEADVVTIETSTHTFMANGITSHNCEDNDYIHRCRLLDVPIEFLPGSYDHYGSAVIKSDHHMKNENDRTYPANVAYYVMKWGGPMGAETFTTPFDGGGSPADWRLDMKRLADLSWRPA